MDWRQSKLGCDRTTVLTNRLLCFKALSFVCIKQVERRILGFAFLPLCSLPRALWHCAVRSLSMVSPETEDTQVWYTHTARNSRSISKATDLQEFFNNPLQNNQKKLEKHPVLKDSFLQKVVGGRWHHTCHKLLFRPALSGTIVTALNRWCGPLTAAV